MRRFYPLTALLPHRGFQFDQHACRRFVAGEVFLPVARGTDGGQVRIITFGGIPAVAQQIDVHHTFSAIANRKVFLIVDIVGTEARRLRLGDGNRSS